MTKGMMGFILLDMWHLPDIISVNGIERKRGWGDLANHRGCGFFESGAMGVRNDCIAFFFFFFLSAVDTLSNKL